MKKIIAAVVVLYSILFTACEKNDTTGSSNLADSTILDLSYGADAKQKMDVYLPAGRNASTTVIVLLHGGGFILGDRKDFSAQAQALADRGYAVINLSYRLVDTTGLSQDPPLHMASVITIHDQLADIGLAIGMAASKTAEWNISPAKWAIAGHSAGASLALLYGYGRNTDNRIKAVANWAGATTFAFNDESEFDAYSPVFKEVYFRMTGAEPVNANKLAYMALSPYWVANNQTSLPPTINIRPQDNSIGGIPDASAQLYEQFTSLLNNKNIPNRHLVIAGADHGFSQPGKWEEVHDKTTAFFRQYVR